MAVIVNGDGILTGISSLATSLTDITSGRGTITGVTTVGTLQLGAGVSISSPRTQNAAIFTNNSEFLTVDDAGRVGVGTVTPNSDAHPQNVGKINVGFITARSVAGDIDANTLVVAGISTFVGAINGNVTGTASANAVLTGSTNNTLVTVTGSNAITGESTLTYDGDGLLSMTSSSGPAEITLVAPSSSDSGIYFNDGSNDGAITYDHSTQNMNFRANSQTKLKIEGTTKKLLIQRAPSSDVDITVARAQRWGYSASYQGLIIGNPAVGNMSSLFLNYDPSSNASGAFAGDGREIVVRKNAKIIVPNAADNGFYNGIEFNAGGDRDDGVSRFRQGIIVTSDSANANVLDDYEEGTWTFTITPGGGSYQYNYGQTGYYRKIGNTVFINAWVHLIVSSTVSGGITLGGLPFACQNRSRNWIPVGGYGHASGPSSAGLWLIVTPNATTGSFYYNNTNYGAGANLTAGNLGNSAELYINGSYFTDA